MNSIGTGNLYSAEYFVQDGYTDEQKQELLIDAYSDLTAFHASSLLEYDIPVNKLGSEIEMSDLMSIIMMLPTNDGMSIKDSKLIALIFEILMTRAKHERTAFSLNDLNHNTLTEMLGSHGRYTEQGIKSILRVLRHTQIYYRSTYLSLELMCVFAEHALKHCPSYNSERFLQEIPYTTMTLYELDQYKNEHNIGGESYV